MATRAKRLFFNTVWISDKFAVNYGLRGRVL